MNQLYSKKCFLKYNFVYRSYVFLPQGKDLSRPKIAIVRPGAYDPSKYTVSDIMSVSSVLEKVSYE